MIRIFIVTYKCPFLNDNLKSLFESNADSNDYTVDIIVNHPDLDLKDDYRNRINIHLQSLRDLNSAGFLARDWNQALILGFGDLRRPKADQVILCQDDTLWDKDWKQKLDEIHKKYTFYSGAEGDGFMSFKSNAVRNVGLFDERFCLIGLHEADYFFRQWLYNRRYASINDSSHGRVWNPTEIVASRIMDGKIDGKDYRTDNVIRRRVYRAIANKLYRKKWVNVKSAKWDENFYKKHAKLTKSSIENYLYYPHFEMQMNIKRLQRLGYYLQ